MFTPPLQFILECPCNHGEHRRISIPPHHPPLHPHTIHHPPHTIVQMHTDVHASTRGRIVRMRSHPHNSIHSFHPPSSTTHSTTSSLHTHSHPCAIQSRENGWRISATMTRGGEWREASASEEGRSGSDGEGMEQTRSVLFHAPS